jgi:hypothetical protein
MEKHETLSYEEQFKDQSVSFSPYALWNTGIAPAQTLLKVDTYNLACVPYQFGMRKAALICALSKDELVFFQRFKNALAGLALSFQQTESREAIKVFCRCQIEAIGQMKDREQFGLIICSWKPIPPDLAQILGEYFLCVERLRLQYSELEGRSVSVNAETARKLGYNNFAILTVNGEQQKLALFTLGVNRLEFLLPMKAPDLAPGTAGVFSLYFQRYRFSVKGSIESSVRLPTGVQKAKARLEFSAELVQVVTDYLFAERRAEG